MGLEKLTHKNFKCNQWFGRLASAVKFRTNKYEVIRGIWKELAVPSIMYRAEVLSWNAEEFRKLEVAQNKIGRLGLRAKKMVGTETIIIIIMVLFYLSIQYYAVQRWDGVEYFWGKDIKKCAELQG